MTSPAFNTVPTEIAAPLLVNEYANVPPTPPALLTNREMPSTVPSKTSTFVTEHCALALFTVCVVKH